MKNKWNISDGWDRMSDLCSDIGRLQLILKLITAWQVVLLRFVVTEDIKPVKVGVFNHRSCYLLACKQVHSHVALFYYFPCFPRYLLVPFSSPSPFSLFFLISPAGKSDWWDCSAWDQHFSFPLPSPILNLLFQRIPGTGSEKDNIFLTMKSK